MATTPNVTAPDPYLFYTVMGYPLPPRRECFFYQHDLLLDPVVSTIDPDATPLEGIDDDIPLPFAGSLDDERFQAYRKRLIRYRRLRRTIPFLEAVYVGNSMTFNALNDRSDIDVCIVANTGRLRHVRLRSVLLTTLLGVKETAKKRQGRLSLSFTIDKDHADLHRFKLLPHDPYLIYRIAHLVPVYLRHDDHAFNIFKDNKRILHYLPHHPLRQVISLGVPITRQRNRLRVVTEWLMSGLIGDFFERTIHILWSPILYFKRKNNAEKERYTVIGPGVLKFFHDQRAYFALKRKVARDSK